MPGPSLPEEHAKLRTAIFHFIEIFYSRQRLHSSLGYLIPEAYGRRYAHTQTVDSLPPHPNSPRRRANSIYSACPDAERRKGGQGFAVAIARSDGLAVPAPTSRVAVVEPMTALGL